MMMMGNEEKKDYNLKVGDFLKYEISVNNTAEKHNVTFEIQGINGTLIHYTYSTSSSYTEHRNSTEDQTPFAMNMTYFPSGDMTNVGKETINTQWGEKSTDHYTNATIGIDVWMLNGVMLRYQVLDTTSTLTEILTETNMEKITD